MNRTYLVACVLAIHITNAEQFEGDIGKGVEQMCAKGSIQLQVGNDRSRQVQVNTIKPFDCAVHSGPIQVTPSETPADGYDIKSLNPANGHYSTIFSLSPSSISPGSEYLDSCAVSPDADIVHCTVHYSDGSSYLVQVDDSPAMVMVARLPSKRLIAGSFSPDGAYYFSDGLWLWYIEGVSSLASSSSKEDVVDFSSLLPIVEDLAGIADIVVVTNDFMGTGSPEHFILSLSRDCQVVLVDQEARTVNLLNAVMMGGECSNSGYGAGFYFEGRAFFSANDGSGVYEILLDTIDLEQMSASVKMIGKSDSVNLNDGMNCMHSKAPEKWCAEGECEIWGDPHVTSFDRATVSFLEIPNDPQFYRPFDRLAGVTQLGGVVWLVKSQDVHIQGSYKRIMSKNRPYLVGVAVGGPFLRENVLIIQGKKHKVWWNDQSILEQFPHYEFERKNFVHVKQTQHTLLVADPEHEGLGIEAKLPNHVKLTVNRYTDKLALKITMPVVDDGQDGQCGNFNGLSADDALELIEERGHLRVSSADSLFHEDLT